MTTRRLLKTQGSSGLYVTTDPTIGTRTSWEPLPQPDNVDPAVRLLAEQGGPKEVAVSLYGNPGRSEAERRQLADRADSVLAAWGIRSSRRRR